MQTGKNPIALMIVIFSCLILGIIFIQWEGERNIHTLFLATLKNDNQAVKTINIKIYDAKKNKNITSKTISIKDSIALTKNTAHGANDGVQYNAETEDIFFLTTGKGGMGGENDCMNADGTCVDRIYKININDSNPVVHFSTPGSIGQWIVSDIDHSIIAIVRNEDPEANEKNHIIKIDSKDGKIIFSKPYNINGSTGSLEKSRDLLGRTWLVQAMNEYTPRAVLYINKINNNTGEYKQINVYEGKGIESNTNISPNGRYLAFYGGLENDRKLMIYNFNKEKITEISSENVGNFRLFWSGDSKKLLHIPSTTKDYTGSYLSFYNIKKNTSTVLEDGSFVFSWAPATQYLLYENQKGVAIYNFENQESTQVAPEDISSTQVLGTQWL